MKAGDKVTFTKVRYQGSSIVFSCTEGRLLEDIADGATGTALVKTKNGRIYSARISTIRPENKKGHLTEMVIGKE